MNITSGLMLPLTTADLLTHAIVGSVLENLDMERLVREVGEAVSQRILGNNESVDDVARELHERLLLRNESTKKVVIESIYRDCEEAKHNVNVYMNSATLGDARPHLKRVRHLRRDHTLTLVNPVYAGPWHSVHGQIPTCTDDLTALVLCIFPICFADHRSAGDAREPNEVAQAVRLAPAQGRDRLRRLRCTEERECLRHRGCYDAVLACRGQGGLWWYSGWPSGYRVR